MSDIDKDIASKHDLRTSAGKIAAKNDQEFRENWKEFWGVLLFSIIFIWYLIYTIYALYEGIEIAFFDIKYSDFVWWGWTLYCLFFLAGIGTIMRLFTEFSHNLVTIIIIFIIGAAVIGFFLY